MRTAAVLALALVACSKETKPASDTKSPAPTPVTAPAVNALKVEPQVDTPDGATKRVAGDHFALDLASSGCKAGAECTLTIKLAVEGDFHVNKDYPYRFLAAEAPGVEFLGKPDKTKFTKDAGDFVADGEKTATMTVRFKPAAAGKTKVAGTYKMSVCSADQCQIEEPSLELVIPAS
ncbi:MAG: hypothetical protein KIT84_43465 [Labilithrix sp.]|nr:hypothetical protein [Labilithrix sp.]